MGKIVTLSQEEIEQFRKSPGEELRERVEKLGDAETLAQLDGFFGMYNSSHDLYTSWVLSQMDALYKHAGAEVLTESLLNFFGPMVVPPDAKDHYNISFHDRVVALIQGCRKSHNCGVIVDDEDDEKLTFHMAYCGAGQRLVDMGWYDEPRNMTRCPASHLTAGLDNFPLYCCHDPAIDMAWMQRCGYPKKVLDYADPVASCPCKYIVYRRKEDIPEHYFTRDGFEKP